MPIVLWSVVVSHFTAADPGRRGRTGRGAGRVMTVLLSIPRLCPRPARTSHWADAARITSTGVTIADLPDTYGT
ncbi:hypothetical protein SAV14893_072290 [Streptomyces avermitilis]|uniref:Uncharacterized protein n=1 Tax=Streptomyces avermitilis TaxID=33903 RepID=A0A4D4MIF9_STRAX|nr:hypothetical protein SAVMC3_85150 [Streptomyces avermitilis]GDY67836.1 hypothetical protein SAV14893_072290 [Streptomyces avermitilis]GDY71842.1 hypothetical protein SAV31267_013270 [Streptomyces avermitilis]GDY81019.1 hypothetical protein SAVCW2_02180 [Streptomyces avermitilis]